MSRQPALRDLSVGDAARQRDERPRARRQRAIPAGEVVARISGRRRNPATGDGCVVEILSRGDRGAAADRSARRGYSGGAGCRDGKETLTMRRWRKWIGFL